MKARRFAFVSCRLVWCCLVAGCSGRAAAPHADAESVTVDASSVIDASVHMDAGATVDAHVALDASIARDAASTDAGSDASVDSSRPDGARPDAGSDAGPLDAGPTPDWATCSVPSDCVLAKNGCCDTCATPTLTDVDAVNRTHLPEHTTAVCPTPMICPACVGPRNPWLIATCVAGRCTAIDMHEDALTQGCTIAAECNVRAPTCCECDSAIDAMPIAIRSDAESDFEALVCDPRETCPPCTPLYPADATRQCIAGRCNVRSAP